MRLTEAIEQLAIATRADGRSVRTVDSYRQKLASLVVFLGDVPIEQVTVNDLRAWIASLMDRATLYPGTDKERAGGLSLFTIAGHIRSMKRLFNWLESEGTIEVNPARRIRTPQPKRKEPKGILWSDFLALLKTTEGGTVIDVRDRAVIMFLFDTACRVAGLTGLTVDDIDIDHRRALVLEKGDKSRAVFFTDWTAQALTRWLEVRPSGRGPWLFTSFKGQSDKFTARGVSHMLTRRAKRAGVTGPCNPHAFRHGFARHYLTSGGNLGTLSDIMGHSDVSVTKSFYGIFSRDELQREHDKYSPLAGLEGGENGE